MRGLIKSLCVLLGFTAAVHAATITGTVSTAGTPVVGAKVVLINQTGVRIDSAITDSLGQYTFINVAIGRYALEGSKTGYNNGFGTANVTTANQTVTANIILTPIASGTTGRIAGLVRRASDSMPIANARLILSRTIGPNTTILDTVFTNALGQYLLDSVPAFANYTVTVSAIGYQTATSTGVAVTAGGNTLLNVFLTAVVAVNPADWNSRRLHWSGNGLTVEIGYSTHNRNVAVFGLNGSLKQRVLVLAGETSVLLTPETAQTRDILLRVE